MKEYGNKPGDMSSTVENYQPNSKSYMGEQSGKTTKYIQRRDKIQDSEASALRSKNSYKGRYE